MPAAGEKMDGTIMPRKMSKWKKLRYCMLSLLGGCRRAEFPEAEWNGDHRGQEGGAEGEMTGTKLQSQGLNEGYCQNIH